MLAVAGHKPKTWRELLNALTPEVVDQLTEYPWYAEADFSLPISSDVGDIGTRANAVQRNLAAEGIKLEAILIEPLLEGRFNRLVKNTRNKAVVMLGLALRLADRIGQLAPEERLRLCVDRLGGRQHYREALSTAMPGYELQILEESAERSAYRLTRSSRICEIEFATGGEDRHLPVALASIYSKYVRELFMHAFNGYWSKKAANLKPTAGYYRDAQRWLKDAAPVLERAGIDLGTLVRAR